MNTTTWRRLNGRPGHSKRQLCSNRQGILCLEAGGLQLTSLRHNHLYLCVFRSTHFIGLGTAQPERECDLNFNSMAAVKVKCFVSSVQATSLVEFRINQYCVETLAS